MNSNNTRMPFRPRPTGQAVSGCPARFFFGRRGLSGMPTQRMPVALRVRPLGSKHAVNPQRKPITTIVRPRLSKTSSTSGESKDPVTRVFVGNISDRAPDPMIQQMLQCFGNMLSWKRVLGASGKLQAFGFCEYEKPSATTRCLRVLNEWKIADRRLIVKADTKTRAVLDGYGKKKHRWMHDGGCSENKGHSKEQELPPNQKAAGKSNERVSGNTAEREDEGMEMGEESEEEEGFHRDKKDGAIREELRAIMKDYTYQLVKDPGSFKSATDEECQPPSRKEDAYDQKFLRTVSKEEEKAQGRRERERRQNAVAMWRATERRQNRQRERELELELWQLQGQRLGWWTGQGGSRSRPTAVATDQGFWVRPPLDDCMLNDGENDWDTNPAKQSETYEAEGRLQGRRIFKRHKTAAYQERLRYWEQRERSKAWEYATERRREGELKILQEHRSVSLKEYLEDYNDTRDDPRFYRGSPLAHRRADREAEKEADHWDRRQERQELEELKRNLREGALLATDAELDTAEQQSPELAHKDGTDESSEVSDRSYSAREDSSPPREEEEGEETEFQDTPPASPMSPVEASWQKNLTMDDDCLQAAEDEEPGEKDESRQESPSLPRSASVECDVLDDPADVDIEDEDRGSVEMDASSTSSFENLDDRDHTAPSPSDHSSPHHEPAISSEDSVHSEENSITYDTDHIASQEEAMISQEDSTSTEEDSVPDQTEQSHSGEDSGSVSSRDSSSSMATAFSKTTKDVVRLERKTSTSEQSRTKSLLSSCSMKSVICSQMDTGPSQALIPSEKDSVSSQTNKRSNNFQPGSITSQAVTTYSKQNSASPPVDASSSQTILTNSCKRSHSQSLSKHSLLTSTYSPRDVDSRHGEASVSHTLSSHCQAETNYSQTTLTLSHKTLAYSGSNSSLSPKENRPILSPVKSTKAVVSTTSVLNTALSKEISAYTHRPTSRSESDSILFEADSINSRGNSKSPTVDFPLSETASTHSSRRSTPFQPNPDSQRCSASRVNTPFQLSFKSRKISKSSKLDPNSSGEASTQCQKDSSPQPISTSRENSSSLQVDTIPQATLNSRWKSKSHVDPKESELSCTHSRRNSSHIKVIPNSQRHSSSSPVNTNHQTSPSSNKKAKSSKAESSPAQGIKKNTNSRGNPTTSSVDLTPREASNIPRTSKSSLMETTHAQIASTHSITTLSSSQPTLTCQGYSLFSHVDTTTKPTTNFRRNPKSHRMDPSISENVSTHSTRISTPQATSNIRENSSTFQEEATPEAASNFRRDSKYARMDTLPVEAVSTQLQRNCDAELTGNSGKNSSNNDKPSQASCNAKYSRMDSTRSEVATSLPGKNFTYSQPIYNSQGSSASIQNVDINPESTRNYQHNAKSSREDSSHSYRNTHHSRRNSTQSPAPKSRKSTTSSQEGTAPHVMSYSNDNPTHCREGSTITKVDDASSQNKSTNSQFTTKSQRDFPSKVVTTFQTAPDLQGNLSSSQMDAAPCEIVTSHSFRNSVTSEMALRPQESDKQFRAEIITSKAVAISPKATPIHSPQAAVHKNAVSTSRRAIFSHSKVSDVKSTSSQVNSVFSQLQANCEKEISTPTKEISKQSLGNSTPPGSDVAMSKPTSSDLKEKSISSGGHSTLSQTAATVRIAEYSSPSEEDFSDAGKKSKRSASAAADFSHSGSNSDSHEKVPTPLASTSHFREDATYSKTNSTTKPSTLARSPTENVPLKVLRRSSDSGSTHSPGTLTLSSVNPVPIQTTAISRAPTTTSKSIVTPPKATSKYSAPSSLTSTEAIRKPKSYKTDAIPLCAPTNRSLDEATQSETMSTTSPKSPTHSSKDPSLFKASFTSSKEVTKHTPANSKSSVQHTPTSRQVASISPAKSIPSNTNTTPFHAPPKQSQRDPLSREENLARFTQNSTKIRKTSISTGSDSTPYQAAATRSPKAAISTPDKSSPAHATGSNDGKRPKHSSGDGMPAFSFASSTVSKTADRPPKDVLTTSPASRIESKNSSIYSLADTVPLHVFSAPPAADAILSAKNSDSYEQRHTPPRESTTKFEADATNSESIYITSPATPTHVPVDKTGSKAAPSETASTLKHSSSSPISKQVTSRSRTQAAPSKSSVSTPPHASSRQSQRYSTAPGDGFTMSEAAFTHECGISSSPERISRSPKAVPKQSRRDTTLSKASSPSAVASVCFRGNSKSSLLKPDLPKSTLSHSEAQPIQSTANSIPRSAISTQSQAISTSSQEDSTYPQVDCSLPKTAVKLPKKNFTFSLKNSTHLEETITNSQTGTSPFKDTSITSEDKNVASFSAGAPSLEVTCTLSEETSTCSKPENSLKGSSTLSKETNACSKAKAPSLKTISTPFEVAASSQGHSISTQSDCTHSETDRARLRKNIKSSCEDSTRALGKHSFQTVSTSEKTPAIHKAKATCSETTVTPSKTIPSTSEKNDVSIPAGLDILHKTAPNHSPQTSESCLENSVRSQAALIDVPTGITKISPSQGTTTYSKVDTTSLKKSNTSSNDVSSFPQDDLVSACVDRTLSKTTRVHFQRNSSSSNFSDVQATPCNSQKYSVNPKPKITCSTEEATSLETNFIPADETSSFSKEYPPSPPVERSLYKTAFALSQKNSTSLRKNSTRHQAAHSKFHKNPTASHAATISSRADPTPSTGISTPSSSLRHALPLKVMSTSSKHATPSLKSNSKLTEETSFSEEDSTSHRLDHSIHNTALKHSPKRFKSSRENSIRLQSTITCLQADTDCNNVNSLPAEGTDNCLKEEAVSLKTISVPPETVSSTQLHSTSTPVDPTHPETHRAHSRKNIKPSRETFTNTQDRPSNFRRVSTSPDTNPTIHQAKNNSSKATVTLSKVIPPPSGGTVARPHAGTSSLKKMSTPSKIELNPIDRSFPKTASKYSPNNSKSSEKSLTYNTSVKVKTKPIISQAKTTCSEAAISLKTIHSHSKETVFGDESAIPWQDRTLTKTDRLHSQTNQENHLEEITTNSHAESTLVKNNPDPSQERTSYSKADRTSLKTTCTSSKTTFSFLQEDSNAPLVSRTPVKTEHVHSQRNSKCDESSIRTKATSNYFQKHSSSSSHTTSGSRADTVPLKTVSTPYQKTISSSKREVTSEDDSTSLRRDQSLQKRVLTHSRKNSTTSCENSTRPESTSFQTGTASVKANSIPSTGTDTCSKVVVTSLKTVSPPPETVSSSKRYSDITPVDRTKSETDQVHSLKNVISPFRHQRKPTGVQTATAHSKANPIPHQAKNASSKLAAPSKIFSSPTEGTSSLKIKSISSEIDFLQADHCTSKTTLKYSTKNSKSSLENSASRQKTATNIPIGNISVKIKPTTAQRTTTCSKTGTTSLKTSCRSSAESASCSQGDLVSGRVDRTLSKTSKSDFQGTKQSSSKNSTGLQVISSSQKQSIVSQAMTDNSKAELTSLKKNSTALDETSCSKEDFSSHRVDQTPAKTDRIHSQKNCKSSLDNHPEVTPTNALKDINTGKTDLDQSQLMISCSKADSTSLKTSCKSFKTTPSFPQEDANPSLVCHISAKTDSTNSQRNSGHESSSSPKVTSPISLKHSISSSHTTNTCSRADSIPLKVMPTPYQETTPSSKTGTTSLKAMSTSYEETSPSKDSLSPQLDHSLHEPALPHSGKNATSCRKQSSRPKSTSFQTDSTSVNTHSSRAETSDACSQENAIPLEISSSKSTSICPKKYTASLKTSCTSTAEVSSFSQRNLVSPSMDRTPKTVCPHTERKSTSSCENCTHLKEIPTNCQKKSIVLQSAVNCSGAGSTPSTVLSTTIQGTDLCSEADAISVKIIPTQSEEISHSDNSASPRVDHDLHKPAFTRSQKKSTISIENSTHSQSTSFQTGTASIHANSTSSEGTEICSKVEKTSLKTVSIKPEKVSSSQRHSTSRRVDCAQTETDCAHFRKNTKSSENSTCPRGKPINVRTAAPPYKDNPTSHQAKTTCSKTSNPSKGISSSSDAASSLKTKKCCPSDINSPRVDTNMSKTTFKQSTKNSKSSLDDFSSLKTTPTDVPTGNNISVKAKPTPSQGATNCYKVDSTSLKNGSSPSDEASSYFKEDSTFTLLDCTSLKSVCARSERKSKSFHENSTSPPATLSKFKKKTPAFKPKSYPAKPMPANSQVDTTTMKAISTQFQATSSQSEKDDTTSKSYPSQSCSRSTFGQGELIAPRTDITSQPTTSPSRGNSKSLYDHSNPPKTIPTDIQADTQLKMTSTQSEATTTFVSTDSNNSKVFSNPSRASSTKSEGGDSSLHVDLTDSRAVSTLSTSSGDNPISSEMHSPTDGILSKSKSTLSEADPVHFEDNLKSSHMKINTSQGTCSKFQRKRLQPSTASEAGLSCNSRKDSKKCVAPYTVPFTHSRTSGRYSRAISTLSKTAPVHSSTVVPMIPASSDVPSTDSKGTYSSQTNPSLSERNKNHHSINPEELDSSRVISTSSEITITHCQGNSNSTEVNFTPSEHIRSPPREIPCPSQLKPISCRIDNISSQVTPIHSRSKSTCSQAGSIPNAPSDSTVFHSQCKPASSTTKDLASPETTATHFQLESTSEEKPILSKPYPNQSHTIASHSRCESTSPKPKEPKLQETTAVYFHLENTSSEETTALSKSSPSQSQGISHISRIDSIPSQMTHNDVDPTPSEVTARNSGGKINSIGASTTISQANSTTPLGKPLHEKTLGQSGEDSSSKQMEITLPSEVTPTITLTDISVSEASSAPSDVIPTPVIVNSYSSEKECTHSHATSPHRKEHSKSFHLDLTASEVISTPSTVAPSDRLGNSDSSCTDSTRHSSSEETTKYFQGDETSFITSKTNSRNLRRDSTCSTLELTISQGKPTHSEVNLDQCQRDGTNSLSSACTNVPIIQSKEEAASTITKCDPVKIPEVAISCGDQGRKRRLMTSSEGQPESKSCRLEPSDSENSSSKPMDTILPSEVTPTITLTDISVSEAISAPSDVTPTPVIGNSYSSEKECTHSHATSPHRKEHSKSFRLDLKASEAISTPSSVAPSDRLGNSNSSCTDSTRHSSSEETTKYFQGDETSFITSKTISRNLQRDSTCSTLKLTISQGKPTPSEVNLDQCQRDGTNSLSSACTNVSIIQSEEEAASTVTKCDPVKIPEVAISCGDQGRKRRLMTSSEGQPESKSCRLEPSDSEGNDNARQQKRRSRFKRRQIMELVDSIPVGKIDLYNYPLDWDIVDQTLADTRIRPWVKQKLAEYTGEAEASLTDLICDKVAAHSSPQSIQDDVAEVF